jgi:UDP-N-acetylmuramoyl-tripeptide--D-alanyl-D-alanine ligase
MKIEDFYSQYFSPGLVSTDSRDIKPGDIFIALKGENFNGDLFAKNALEKGAVVAVVEQIASGSPERIIQVDNTLRFLQDIARYHRKQNGFRIIGLTGTNGKTTTKELIRSVLRQKFRVQSTMGNLNNHIGVPMTLLSIDLNTEIAIVEMGANHPGEISELSEIALPDSGLITNIGKAHLEGFGSFEGVKKTKAELFGFLKKSKGIIYYNGSDTLLSDLVGNYSNKIAYNSLSGICSGKIISTLPALTIELSNNKGEKTNIRTNLYGSYNLENILAASAIGFNEGLLIEEIKMGIESFLPDSMRSQVIALDTMQLIIDCYNANPTSMEQALRSFSVHPSGKKIAILGGMKELGKFEEEEHQKLGELIEQLHFETILLLGQEFEKIKLSNAIYFKTYPELEEFIRQADFTDSAVLIKGSRANKLERIAEVIKSRYSQSN